MTRTRLIVAIAILGPFFWFFGSALFGGQMFAYRDSAFYYYPLFKWTKDEWSQGRVPLWNPQDNLGTPVLADGTSSVLYPGKLLFALPLDFAICFKLYITGHVLLAAWGAYLLARRWHASTLAAGLCAIAYAYGGNVLFQYCNVVFLVGAAWLPFALLAADKMLVERRVSWAFALAAVLALMVLGGDPQAAYHAGLLAALYAWMLRRHDNRQSKERPSLEVATLKRSWPVGLLENRFGLLTVAAMSAAVFAAVQVLPSLELSRQSERAAFENPRTIYETASYLRTTPAGQGDAVRDGLVGRPAGNHHEHIYQFSIAPWQFAEMIWPNCSGRSFPVNRRWTTAIPGGDRVWTPTMYMGLLPLVLALVACRFRRGAVQQRFLTWTVLLGCLAALGWYGLGWIVHELRTMMAAADPHNPAIGEPVGGLYWLMVVVLPGYVSFRYPAKLMVVAALGLSVLAARGWDMSFESKSRKVHWILISILVFSLTCAVAVFFIHPALQVEGLWSQWLQHAPPDDVFGPLDKVGAANDLSAGFLHAIALTCVFLALLRWHRRGGNRAKWAVPMVALFVTVADLIVAQNWSMITAPQEIWEAESPIAGQITHRAADEKSQQLIRVNRSSDIGLAPLDWPATHSTERHVDWAEWNQMTLFPNHHLGTDLSLFGTQTSIVAADFASVLRYVDEYETSFPRPDGNPFVARYTIYSQYGWRSSLFESHEHLDLPDSMLGGGLRVARNPAAYRGWIVPAEKVDWWKPLTTSDSAAVDERTESVLFLTSQTRPDGSRPPRDLIATAIVEAESAPKLPRLVAHRPSLRAGCRVIVDQPQHVEMEAELTQRGLLVLNDFFYPGWTAEVIPDGDESAAYQSPILRTNRVMRGVYLPPGKHRVIFRYEPMSFRIGAIVSVGGWLAFGFGLILAAIATRRRK